METLKSKLDQSVVAMWSPEKGSILEVTSCWKSVPGYQDIRISELTDIKRKLT